MGTTERRYIYRQSIRLRDGRRIYAWQYGKQAFKIEIEYDPEQPKPPST